MSFEVFLQGQADLTSNLPRKSDLLAAFAGYVLEDTSRSYRLANGRQVAGQVLRVGAGGHDCVIYCDDDGSPDPIQSSLMVERPLAAGWLWDRLYGLLRDYDLFMVWPADEFTAAIARPGVPLPAGMNARIVTVADGTDLSATVVGS